MQSRLGYDLSTVRIHTGSRAEDEAREFGARAFTFGKDIFFGAGEYAPGTRPGEQLLAHELAHVIQQSRTGAYPGERAQQASLENAADEAAGALTSSDSGLVEVSGASANWVACNRRSSSAARRLRRGVVRGMRFQEGPRDVIAIRISNTGGDMEGILSGIDAVMANFGSAGRTYVQTLGFAAALESRLSELGHPAATGGGTRMSRDRWLTVRVRIVRDDRRRIEGLRLMPQLRVSEAPEGLTIEGEEPEPVVEVSPVVETPDEEPAAPSGWRGWARSIGEGLGTAGDFTSGRWVWDPIMRQMAEWERDLAAIGETEGRTIEVSGTEAALVPIGIVFTVIHGILGTADLLARLNPYNVALQNLSRQARAVSGSYTREQLEQDLSDAGQEAWGIVTLGLGRAIDHMREGIRDANAFRTTQAVTEIVMAILAVIGLVAGVRSLSSRARMSTAVEAEAAAGAEVGVVEAATPRQTTTTEVATRPTEPGPGAVERSTVPEPDLPYRPTEPGPGAVERATIPEPDLPYRATEPGAGAAERATVPGPDLPYRPTEPALQSVRPSARRTAASTDELARRPTEPGSGAGERTTVAERGLAERPTEAGSGAGERTTVPEPGLRVRERPPTAPGGGLRVRRPVRDLAEARRLRDRLISEAEGVELMPDHAYFTDEFRALGGRGEVPYAYEMSNGRAVIDVSRTGWPTQEVMSTGAERIAARAEAARPPVEAWSEGPSEMRPALPRPGVERTTETGPPTLREPWRDLPDEALGRSTAPGHPPLRVPGRLAIRSEIRNVAAARRLMEQYVSGQRGGGYVLRHDHVWMRDEWHAFGRTGEPPPAFVQTNGSVVFDTTRLGWPSQRALGRGAHRLAARAEAAQEARIAAGAARRAAATPRWARRIETPAEARIEIDRLVDAGEGMRRVRNMATEEAYLARWRAAGGEGPAPVAFFDEAGALIFNQQGMGGM